MLIAMLFAHWLGDYTHLSRPYMLQAKRTGSPLIPILHHALAHAILQSITVYVFTEKIYETIAVFLFQLITHFAIDVWKGKMNVWFPPLSNPANPYHWYVFGIDQWLHQIVIITTFAYCL